MKTKTEEAKVTSEITKESLEAVQMTAAQKDEFVAYMAAKKTKDEDTAKAAEEAGKFTNMRLVFKHNINGVQYGPGGMVEVPLSQLGALIAAEEAFRQHEFNLNMSKSQSMQIMGGGGSQVGGVYSKTVPVPSQLK